jgi:predicted Na+-dependent transporter
MAMAVSFVVVLMLINIIAAPLWAKAIVTGATVHAGVIIKDLLILVLIPLALGLAGRARYAEHAPSWRAGLERISNIALYIAIAAGLAVNYKTIIHLIGWWVIVCSVVVILINAALGWLVGLKDRPTAISASMISAMRFTPVGLIIIGTQLHAQSAYLAPALVFGLVDTIIPFFLGAEIGRKLGAPANAKTADMTRTAPAPTASDRAPATAAPHSAN